MKKAFWVLLTSACVFLCSSCTGYNRIIYNHLSEADNYSTFQAQLLDVYYIDSESNSRMKDFNNPAFQEQDVYFEVAFGDYENVQCFSGGSPSRDIPPEDYQFILKLTNENHKILLESGFYDDVVLGENVELSASHFIYMDSDFFYIAGVKYNGTEYLSFDTGLANITAMMAHNRSGF